MNKKAFILSFLLSITFNTAHSAPLYQACFTPNNDCTTLIVSEIVKAKKSINIQAFVFTSIPIKLALASAKVHGIDVKMILDKTQENNSAFYFMTHGVPVWIDYKPRIAHNKVIIIDNDTVITGSFNFTTSAQIRNAENVLVIHDKTLAGLYLDNWKARQAESRRISYD